MENTLTPIETEISVPPTKREKFVQQLESLKELANLFISSGLDGTPLKLGEDFVTKSIHDPKFIDWKLNMQNILASVLGNQSPQLKGFNQLTFRSEQFKRFVYDPTAIQNLDAFVRDIKVSLEFLSICFREIQVKVIPSENLKISTQQPPKSNLPKLEWQGTQKELAELFIELHNKGWISELKPDIIKFLFSNSNTIQQILKPGKDKSGNSNFDQVYSKRYQTKFSSILPNPKNTIEQ